MNRSRVNFFSFSSLLFVTSFLIFPPCAVQAEGGSASVGASKAFNPDISVNFLGYARKGSAETNELMGRTSDVHNGLTFQEAEMQFFADVDPYFRANALFSLSPEATADHLDTNNNQTNLVQRPGFGLSPEEVFFETIALPFVNVRVGKFKAAVGKHNSLHTHAYPFIDAPLINQDLFGGEGLNETGVSISSLFPHVSWFMELTAQALSSNNDTLYNSPNSGDYSGVLQLKNLWDLSDDSTLEWTLFGTQGKNPVSLNSHVYGTDLILKWRPALGGKYHALIFANEYLNGASPVSGFTLGPSATALSGDHLDGLASWLQYQFAERWWIQGRIEHEGFTRSGQLPVRNKQSALLALNPSEFSGFRIQYDHTLAANQPEDHAVTLQWNITIGAHPAHSY